MKYVLVILSLSVFVFIWSYKLLEPKSLHEAADITPEIKVSKTVLGTTSVSCPSADSLDVLIDKLHALPTNYVPKDLVNIGGFKLRSEAAVNLTRMLGKMGESNLFVSIESAYRTSEDQAELFQNGDLKSAQPGNSEHQLGTCVDFALTYPSKQWTWLDKNAHKYGFVMSYRYGQTIGTGYQFEPWHWRYVGATLATKIRNSSKLPQSFYKPLNCN